MENEYEKQLHVQKGRIDDLQHSLWTYVHTSLPEFPEVDYEGPTEMAAGIEVGECTIYQRIGAGRMSKVYVARNQRAGRNEAIKAIQKTSLDSLAELKDILREVKLLRQLQHRNVVHLYEFVHTEHFLLLHMEIAGSRNLFRFMCDAGGRLALKAAHDLAAQVAQALAHCHENNVAHCDVKPENVVISKDGSHAKLVDFGFAVEIGAPCTSLRGTMPFVAPEVLMEDAVYNPAPADVWFWHLVAGDDLRIAQGEQNDGVE
jgi:serine/threonine protein kinase